METPDLLNAPTGDAGVRPGTAADADGLGAIHERSWRTAYVDLLPDAVLASIQAPRLAEAWRGAISSPPSSSHRVLVAHHGLTVVGFVAVGPEGEIIALHVDPQHQRRGHASRLLSAAADHAQQLGESTIHTWCVMDDMARRDFFTSAGFGADGRWREFSVPGAQVPLREAHLVASFDEPL